MPAPTPVERLEFNHTVEGLFVGALGAKGDPGLLGLLRDAGLDLTGRLAPAYAAEDFYRWVKLAARYLHPELDEQQALGKIAEAAVHRGLQATLIGRALLGLMKTLGIRRALLRIGRAFRNGNNYIEATVTEVGPTALDIRLNTVMDAPGYFKSILEQGTQLLGGKNVRVIQLANSGESRTFRVEWAE